MIEQPASEEDTSEATAGPTAREYNAFAVVRDHVTASAVSRRLQRVRPRTAKIGYGKPWTESPRTSGFMATQEGPFAVEVWWRPNADDDPAATEAAYTALTEELLAAGFDVEAHPGPGLRAGRPQVTRMREPSAAEWTALETLAPHPLDLTSDGAADGVPAEVAASLLWSSLATRISYPLVRTHVYDPSQGHLLALSNAGRKLLEDRIAHERWERDRASLPPIRIRDERRA